MASKASSKKRKISEINSDSDISEWEKDLINSNDIEIYEDFALVSDHSSNTDEDISGTDYEQVTINVSERNLQYAYRKNKYKWTHQEPKKNVPTRLENIVSSLPGLTSSICNKNTAEPIQTWNFLFCDQMLEIILKCTNKKLEEYRKISKNNKYEIYDLDIIELKAFLGLLVYSSIFKSNHEDVRSLFATDGTGREIFRYAMSWNRFCILLYNLRFDNIEDRTQLSQTDPAAAISEILQLFISNSQSVYSIGPYICIDEIPIPFRGRCKFKMNMPNKPAKYGLKIQCMTDAHNNYIYNAYLYCGKNTDGLGLSAEEKKFSIPTQIVLRLTKPITHTNRNVTADNWYSSIELAEALRSRGLTYVGTLKKNKPEIPPELLALKDRKIGSALHVFTKHLTLLSYVPKKGKVILLLSSMHHSKGKNKDADKPEIIDFYNSTKGGEDSFDQKCTLYCSNRRTRRLPIAVFLRILGMANVNAYVLYQSYESNPKILRYNFCKSIAFDLVKLHLQRKVNNNYIPRNIRNGIQGLLGIQPAMSQATIEKLVVRKYCTFCPARAHRKTAYLCFSCNRAICLQCARKACKDCTDEL